MRIDSRSKDKPRGVVVDENGKRIPFVIWCDFDTGDFEAYKSTPDGRYLLGKEGSRDGIKYSGRSPGLKLLSIHQAKNLVPASTVREPKKVDPAEGLETYKEVFFEVWNGVRGDASKVVDSRWNDFIKRSSFLDHLVIRRKSVRVTQ